MRFLTVFSVHLEFEIHHLRFETFFSSTLSWLREVDGSECFDSSTVDTAVVAWDF